MAFRYFLPDEHGNPVEHNTETNSLIIIGANGAGKSKLGAWIEKQEPENVHRIGAQRSLNFSENIALKNYSQAEDLVFYGTNDRHTIFQNNKNHRWGWGHETTQLIDDFENVLAALLALENNKKAEFFNLCRKAETEGRIPPQTPTTSVDLLQRIWHEVLPHRELVVDDSKFYAELHDGTITKRYPALEMSDGERSVLYLVAQVLCVPKNKTLIVDEPELHLHRSIMNRLWMALEKYRPDCFFIYITHDTQFASSHTNATTIWIKEYDGVKWLFQEINSEDFPDELLIEILGNRKDVLFVEGERGSYDAQLYPYLYPKFHIIPCGSCTQVIMRTKAFRKNPSLHHCNVYGIIDRDYRSEHEIEQFKSDGIYTINVSEIENLFIVEGIIRFMAVHMGMDADDVFNQVKKYVIETKFGNQINRQICQSVVAEIKYRLSSIDISYKNEKEAKSSLDNAIRELKYDEIQADHEGRFQEILGGKNYADVLKVFNEKGIRSSVGHFFRIDDRQYCNTVIDLLRGAHQAEIITALLPYLPPEIPR